MALAAGRLYDFFTIVDRLLNTYAPGRAYVELDQWHGAPCNDCSGNVSEDDRYACGRCEETLCPDCAMLCGQCDQVYCSGCSATCQLCDKSTCSSCLDAATRAAVWSAPIASPKTSVPNAMKQNLAKKQRRILKRA